MSRTSPSVGVHAATVGKLDLSGVDEELLTPRRISKWSIQLDKLYAATASGKVARNTAGVLKFVKLGTFKNVTGARIKAREFEKDARISRVYEFRTVRKSQTKTSELWARVREVEEPVAMTPVTEPYVFDQASIDQAIESAAMFYVPLVEGL